MASIFTKIVNGEIPAYKIAETADFVAFLDVFPLVLGHTLVIPKHEIDYIFDLEDKQLADLHVFAKKIAKAVGAAVPCKRVGMAIIGLEVPHAHIHLVPLQTVNDINFAQPKVSFSKEKMEEVAAAIRAKLN